MIESYLALSRKEQAQILRALSINENIKKEALILEKDIWICWALEFLFKMPNRFPMAFKGGTSLSKAFQIIERFSEDIDITIDYQAFNCGNPFADGISKTKLKSIGSEIKSRLTQYLKEVLLPYYREIIADQFKENAPSIELDDDGETLILSYSSVLEQKNGYIADSIRLEFGGRNLVVPNDVYTITADISEHIKNLSFPIAQVSVLSPEKTYWEKLTLIHYECNRPSLKTDANRISRHWYDIVMLTNHDIGKKAMLNRDLLKEVVKIKKTFYDSSYADYEACLSGRFRLMPNDEYLELLKKDFNHMLNNKMFYGNQPNFETILNTISALESQLNLQEV